MIRYSISPAAKADLEEIWLYIATDNLDAADRLLDEFSLNFKRLVDNPHLGPERTDLVSQPVRFLRSSSYLIVYQVRDSEITIIRVLSAYRDITNELIGE